MSERRDIGEGKTALIDGSQVGPYTVEYLACGGMSCVYKGTAHGKTFVLKEVAASNTRDVPSLISEKTLLERLDHPGIVTYHTFFNENEYYYLVLEYIDGHSLSDLICGTATATPPKIADWGIQLCEVFEYLHDQKPPIIYRDLKAENIMLEDGKIKLLDFGIARLHKGARAKDTELMGSPVTASPEHYGGAETDARSDIYTIGATLYELMTGGERKKLGAFQFAPVRELNPDVSPELERVLTKATEFEPKDRYQSALALKNALLRALGRDVEKAPTTTNLPERTDPVKKKKSPLLAIVLLLVLAVGAWGGWQGYLAHQATKSPFYGGPVPSIGTFEKNLKADIFSAGDVDGRSVVLMGEDIGLFQVAGWREQSANKRAEILAQRLNSMYHQACLICGGTGLEPKDIKMGKHEETGEIVVFYAHMHGRFVKWGPELLATVNQDQAAALDLTPRFVASYWRDLVRDTVRVSRGFEVENSVLGPELSNALLRARDTLKEDTEQLTRLRVVLSELTGKESLKLRSLFLEVPDRKSVPDTFPKVKGYRPLNM